MLSDAEVVCEFMEEQGVPYNGVSRRWFWHIIRCPGLDADLPCTLDLDTLRKVQERLTDEQWRAYAALLSGVQMRTGVRVAFSTCKALIHASAEQKIVALACVLRGLTVTERGASAEGNSSTGKGVVQGEEKR